MNSDHLGFYLVGWKKFYNKTLALIESKKTGYSAVWIFNDDVYSKIDWTTPIESSLKELYKKRAKQLREEYDYLVLYYSGGADSTNVLHSFIDNGIFIDEILIQDLKIFQNQQNNKDLSNANFYSEIEFAANAHLKKVKNQLDPRTKITYQDFTKVGLEMLEKDFRFEENPIGMSINVSGVLRQLTQAYDRYNLNLLEKEKRSAFILGIDKPLVYFDGTDYLCFFKDTGAYHYVNPFNSVADKENKVIIEYFYWSRSMPEIVVKQAQEIKKNCETHPWAKTMASQVLVKHISEFRSVLHPVIYPPHVIESFQTEKPSTGLYRPMDKWFWETASEKVKNNYIEIVQYLSNNIAAKDGIDGNVQNGFGAHKTRFYRL